MRVEIFKVKEVEEELSEENIEEERSSRRRASSPAASPVACRRKPTCRVTASSDLRGGAGLSFVLLVPALAVFLLQRYWVSRRFYVT
jgi:hypothetical protein